MNRLKNILITNDDGVYSKGLKLLYESVNELGDAKIVAPETPKSSTGLGITLHKPLRLYPMEINGLNVYATNGTPSDIIYLALKEIFNKIDLVVSGVNIGDNTSVQVILSSGTVGAAAQAAIVGIPSIAFSADVKEEMEITRKDYYDYINIINKTISKYVLDNGFPKGVHLLNVNYPSVINSSTKVKIAKPANVKFTQKISINRDPAGRKYYWLYGSTVKPKNDTDVHVVHVEKAIAITPIYLGLFPYRLNKDTLLKLNYLTNLITKEIRS